MTRRPMLNAAGGTRAWTRTVKQFTATNRVCWLQFPGCTVKATTIDHYWPVKYRPDLTDKPWNWRPACNHCNRTRRHTPPYQIPVLRAELQSRQRPRQALRFFG